MACFTIGCKWLNRNLQLLPSSRLREIDFPGFLEDELAVVRPQCRALLFNAFHVGTEGVAEDAGKNAPRCGTLEITAGDTVMAYQACVSG